MKGKEKSLVANSVWNGLKTVWEAAFTTISFIYASRILGVSEIGKVDYANSLATYFILLSELGITVYAIREGAKLRDDSKALNQFSTEIFIIQMISTILCSLGIFWLSGLDKFSPYRVLILIGGTAMVCSLLGRNWVFQVFEDYSYIAVKTIGLQSILLILMISFVKTPNDTVIYAILLVLSSGGVNLINMLFIKKRVRFCFGINHSIKRHFRPILYIFMNNVASQIYLNMDISLIGYMRGDYETGLYTAAVRISRIFTMISAAVCGTLVPRLSRLIKQKKKSEYNLMIRISLNMLMMLAIPFGAGCILLRREMLFVLNGEAFLASDPILYILSVNMVFAAINGFLALQILVPFEYEKKLLLATGIGAVVNAVLNIFLIEQYGAMGAAYATVVSEIAVFIVLNVSVWQIHIESALYADVWKYVVATLIMSLIGYLLYQFKLPIIPKIAVVCVGCVVIYAEILFRLKSTFFLLGIQFISDKFRRKE